MSRWVCQSSCIEEMNNGDEQDTTVVIYKNVDDFKGYYTEMEKSAPKSKLLPLHTGSFSSSSSTCVLSSLTSVCVLLLCAFLLTGVTVLWIRYNNLTEETETLQQTTAERESVLKALGWRLFGSSAYYITSERKNWTETRQDCIGRGADLVIINNREEQEFIRKYSVGKTVWIGLTDTETEGIFEWVDGSPLTTEFWIKGEPNDLGGEDCAVANFVGAKSDIENWADFPCNHNVRGICEIKSYKLR